jgi:peptidoglycan/xylan/chitin deacetylase (PgdA/CDA1 family)
MQMKKNHLVKLSSLALLFAFFALTSCATAPKPSYLDPIRWWDQGQQDPIKELAIETPEQLAARVPKRTAPKIVLLMYHNIVFGRTGGEYNRDLYNFEHDLVFLRNRTQIIGLDELPDIQSGKKKLDTDASIITFDDGDLSIYAVVFPLLKQYDIKATFFIITDFVGTTGYVSWDQLKQMSDYRNAKGEKLFTIGSHSLDHKRFDEIPADQISRELSESKLAIEGKIGAPVRYFALPFGAGAGRKEIIDTAKNLGYWGIRSSTPGVMIPGTIDMFNIPAFYMTNERADILAQQIYAKLLGR